jgi:hypothetical protein
MKRLSRVTVSALVGLGTLVALSGCRDSRPVNAFEAAREADAD